MKTRGISKLTYNQLAQLLKLEENSIRKIYEKDQGEEVLYILHDDKENSILYNEGMAIMQKNLDLKQDFNLMIKSKLECLGFDVKDFDRYFPEKVFNVKLLEHQLKSINDWNKTGIRKYNWLRRSGSSYCAAIDALFSAYCGKLDVLYLSATRNESTDHLRMAEGILKNTAIEYTIDNDSIIFPNGCSILFRSNSIDPNGLQFSKMIFDNCDINRRIIHNRCKIIREYTTYEE